MDLGRTKDNAVIIPLAAIDGGQMGVDIGRHSGMSRVVGKGYGLLQEKWIDADILGRPAFPVVIRPRVIHGDLRVDCRHRRVSMLWHAGLLDQQL
jgi:hypothetical protein